MLRTVPPNEQHDSPPPTLPADDLPAAPVVGMLSVNGTRYAMVACPFCVRIHRHVFPGGLSYPVGVRPAPCRRGALYRPESAP